MVLLLWFASLMGVFRCSILNGYLKVLFVMYLIRFSYFYLFLDLIFNVLLKWFSFCGFCVFSYTT